MDVEITLTLVDRDDMRPVQTWRGRRFGLANYEAAEAICSTNVAGVENQFNTEAGYDRYYAHAEAWVLYPCRCCGNLFTEQHFSESGDCEECFHEARHAV